MGRLLALGAAAVAAFAAIGAALRAKRRTDAPAGEKSPPAPGASTMKKTPASATRETSPGAPVTADTPERGEVHSDDLTSIKGIGSVSAERLAGIGVTTLAQIAAWTPADVDGIGARIKISPERIRREDWVGQAGALLES